MKIEGHTHANGTFDGLVAADACVGDAIEAESECRARYARNPTNANAAALAKAEDALRRRIAEVREAYEHFTQQ